MELVLEKDELVDGVSDVLELVGVLPVCVVVHDGLDRAEDLDADGLVPLGLDLTQTDVEEHIQIVGVEEVALLTHHDRDRLEAFVEAVPVGTVGQVKQLLSVEAFILCEL